MRLIIINGPNINMLGKRDQNLYGSESYKDLIKSLKQYSKTKNISIKCFQSNSESSIINFVQKNYQKCDGLILNLGAFTHYSYAIRDAVELCKKPIVEVHITDINNREEFRKISVIEDLVSLRIAGRGVQGYFDAIDYFEVK